MHISCLSTLWALFPLKPYKAFIIAQGKQSRLVKLLNFDVNFMFKSTSTALLETIVSR